MEIKNINDGINWRTIPKVINDEFSKNGHIRSFVARRGADGKFKTTYGEMMPPMFVHYNYDLLNFFVNLKFVERFDELLDLGLIFDENLNHITRKKLKPFFDEYSNGFNKGYSEFEDALKKDVPLFGTSNENITYKVYSRIISDKTGMFPMHSTFEFQQSDLEKEVRKERNLKLLWKVKKESFFNSGFEGGEFYKAWEIILNNPTIFESVFTKHFELNKPEQLEPEPLDLSDTTTIETPLFNNKFDTVKESTVIEYFTKKLVETKHISETDLFLFLDLAFDKMKVPKQKISFEHLNTQKKIINVFYEYYKIVAGKPYGKQEKYINLLCDYFIGFEYDKIKTNFAK
jgi:hypothetical protein